MRHAVGVKIEPPLQIVAGGAGKAAGCPGEKQRNARLGGRRVGDHEVHGNNACVYIQLSWPARLEATQVLLASQAEHGLS